MKKETNRPCKGLLKINLSPNSIHRVQLSNTLGLGFLFRFLLESNTAYSIYLANFSIAEEWIWKIKLSLFTLLSRLTSTLHCEVSLPQKTSLICQAKRILERTTMKKRWQLTQSPFCFMVLDRTPFQHVFNTSLNPFTRFNLEEYLQTVLTSDLTHIIYNVLVKNSSEIRKNVNYRILSKYFEMASKLGGVSIILFWTPFVYFIGNSFLCKQHFSVDQTQSYKAECSCLFRHARLFHKKATELR